MNIIIETKRTMLRQIQPSDLDDIAKLNSDSDVRKFFPEGTQDRKQTEARLKEFISFYKEKMLPGFVILDKKTGEFLGRCGFGPLDSGEIEVGYLIVKKYWGMGYASEVLSALLAWSKEHIKIDYVLAFAPLEHKASHRVMEKSGMEYYKIGIGHGVKCKFYRAFLKNQS